MYSLRNIEIFIEVAQARSFTAAARRLGVSRATASKHVSMLEGSLGARLLNRSAQQVSLTDAGQLFLDSSRQILDQFHRLAEDIAVGSSDLSGAIRIGAPPAFGASYLVPMLQAFVAMHPNVKFTLVNDDGGVDLVKEALDLSLRIAPGLRDASYTAQLLTRVPQMVVASEEYLRQKGSPRGPQDLNKHDCLVHSLKAPTNIWSFHGPAGQVSVKVRPVLRSDQGEVLRRAALLGAGISMHPDYMIYDDIARGRLRVLLPSYRPDRLEIHAVYAERRYQPQRVRTLILFLKDWLRDNAPAAAVPQLAHL